MDSFSIISFFILILVTWIIYTMYIRLCDKTTHVLLPSSAADDDFSMDEASHIVIHDFES